ncbi:flagellar filament capping protein FliD [Desulfurobacterium indicum]|uniref:Flagellar hook-associated protein 2 n=1 Tax=Desulfurobacterium indicum TaxID=1914305 RepID=A0A1R1MKW3_9BACT|nr:flagellar filament capping protein FliD [Desulfurobacterium indicum]OMH40451.1 flagellar hook protein [Desulfurobacterium indicum]
MAGELSISNLVGGFDYQQILDQMYSLKSVQIQYYQQRESELQNKKSALSSFDSLLEKFQDIANDLFDDSIFQQKAVSVSNESAVKVTITDPTAVDASSFDVSVVQTAKKDVWLSQAGVSDETAPVATTAGTLQISYGGDVVATIDYDTDTSTDTPSTIQEIANAINAAQDKVKATVFFDGTNYRLLLSGEDTGADNTISVTETGGGDLLDVLQLGDNYTASHVQTAQDAVIEIYGTQVFSSTNDFTDVIPGMTITAEAPTTSPVSITIDNDYSKMKDNLQKLVEAYNSIVDFVKQYTGKDGALSGDFTLQDIRSTLFDKLDPLFQLGLFDVDKDTGHLSINSSKLDEVLSTDPKSLEDALTDDLKNNLYDYLIYVTGVDGPIQTEEKSYDNQINYIEDQIDLTNKRISEEIESMKKQLVQLQLYMAQMQEVQAKITQTFGTPSIIPGTSISTTTGT